MKHQPLLLLGLSFLLSAPVIAQGSKNTGLAGRAKDFARFSDVWGYTAPNGTEYALLGVYNGLAIYDTSVRPKPKLVAFFRGANSTWRDIKTWKNYVYVVTEAGYQGMWIIDMSKPATPRMVNSGWGKTIYRNCHNLAIDTDTGIAYLTGTNVGIVIADLKTNPANPKHLTTYRGPYAHDLHVQNGFAHLAEIYLNRYKILDVSKLPLLTTLGSAKAPGIRYCHNTWATRDDRYCMTTNEASAGPVGIFDISNKKAPKLIAKYQANPRTAPRAIPHNVLIRDRIAYISYYTEGVRFVDISNPSSPREVGFYDTWSGYSSGYNGDWGVYALNPSGNVFVSDITSGLYIVKMIGTGKLYGKATPPSATKPAPEIHQFGAPYLGNRFFAIEAENLVPRALSLLVIGGRAANVTVKGLTLNVDLAAIPPLILPVTSALSKAKVPLPVPNDSNLVGAYVYAQWFQLNSSHPSGLTGSRGLQLGFIRP